MHVDSNCIQVLAPSEEAAVLPANYLSGEHLCHVSRDVALVLSLFMDTPPMYTNDLNEYGVDFYFKCVLLEDSNHREDGFRIKIIVRYFIVDSNFIVRYSDVRCSLLICRTKDVCRSDNPCERSFIEVERGCCIMPIVDVKLLSNIKYVCYFLIVWNIFIFFRNLAPCQPPSSTESLCPLMGELQLLDLCVLNPMNSALHVFSNFFDYGVGISNID